MNRIYKNFKGKQMLFLVGCLMFLTYLMLHTTKLEPDLPLFEDIDISNNAIINYGKVSADCENYYYYSQTYNSSKPRKFNSELPYQRPPPQCRTFSSPIIDKFIDRFTAILKDPNVAAIFENTFPNTLDTTILWHVPGSHNRSTFSSEVADRNNTPETFIVTGDIHAEWLRDSAWQLSVYHPFMKQDASLERLVLGAINTQAKFIIDDPYCNAFHIPKDSGIPRGSSKIDDVFPRPNWDHVYECKYELDSLASFLTLSYEYYTNAPKSRKFDFINLDWFLAVRELINLLDRESLPTFAENGTANAVLYSFKRMTNIGSETLSLGGAGNPVNRDIEMIRSSFRPSDDSTIFQFFIPGNAHMAVELEHLQTILKDFKKTSTTYNDIEFKNAMNKNGIDIDVLLRDAHKFSIKIREGLAKHGIFNHPEFGDVYAYEVDGYGSRLLMDDANIPSLLSLPILGFVNEDDKIYKNTRKMILSPKHNPYYVNGTYFQGIGGSHIGVSNPWPMSLLVRIRTSNDDAEIKKCLKMVVENTGHLGLMHESVNASVAGGVQYTRPWFSWANSEFSKTILHLAERKPHLVLRPEVRERFVLSEFIHKVAST